MAKLKAKMLPTDNKIAIYVNENVNANGKTVAIAFNANYLKTIVDVLGTSELKVYYRDNTRGYSPLLFVDENTGNKALLMPIIKNQWKPSKSPEEYLKINTKLV